ncbi:MAG TPA: hypothetical protein PKA16_01195 [Ottowia sp.]|uniref:hypothetical protein n=1 Tax=Ottowia sp. TaxID=1898956 RepID=UPI002BF5AC37|nr:hypothetical protein [Ottowia sp.]HMN19987.1 hypothetical protein [Ottowia sp.]
MNTTNHRLSVLRTAALLGLLGLGGALALPGTVRAAGPARPAATTQAPAAHARPGDTVVVEEDALFFEPVQGTVYLNGGVGKDEEMKMRKDAHNWPLRIQFSERKDDEFVAGVGLKVFDHSGHAVLRLKDAGPMTYAQVPPGKYRVTARFKEHTLTRTVHVGPKGSDVNFHWAG